MKRLSFALLLAFVGTPSRSPSQADMPWVTLDPNGVTHVRREMGGRTVTVSLRGRWTPGTGHPFWGPDGDAKSGGGGIRKWAVYAFAEPLLTLNTERARKFREGLVQSTKVIKADLGRAGFQALADKLPECVASVASCSQAGSLTMAIPALDEIGGFVNLRLVMADDLYGDNANDTRAPMQAN